MVNPLSITSYIEDLRRGGVDEQTAMTYAKALGRFMNDEFALKSDLQEHTNHLEGEVNLLGRELRTEMKALEDRMNHRFDALENRLMVRLGGMMAAGIGLIAVLQALLK